MIKMKYGKKKKGKKIAETRKKNLLPENSKLHARFPSDSEGMLVEKDQLPCDA